MVFLYWPADGPGLERKSCQWPGANSKFHANPIKFRWKSSLRTESNETANWNVMFFFNSLCFHAGASLLSLWIIWLNAWQAHTAANCHQFENALIKSQKNKDEAYSITFSWHNKFNHSHTSFHCQDNDGWLMIPASFG